MGKNKGPCCHCGIKESLIWRKGPDEKPVLCNPCGVRLRSKGTLDDYMPKHGMKDSHDHSGPSHPVVEQLTKQLLDSAHQQPEIYFNKPMDGDVLIDRADASASNPLETALGAMLLAPQLEGINPTSSDRRSIVESTKTASYWVGNYGNQGEPPAM